MKDIIQAAYKDSIYGTLAENCKDLILLLYTHVTVLNVWKYDNVVSGMECSLCIKHQRRPRKCVIGKAVLVVVPCTSFLRESLSCHGRSDAHKEAQVFERARVLASQSIATEFEREETLNELAMEAAMKCIYWLCKREIAHTTNYVPLDLCEDLSVDVLNSLFIGLCK